MRLRYQMRGLGIGIIVTALLMGVANRDKAPLSDAEIRARAMELGMVESGSRKLSDIADVTANPESGEGEPLPSQTQEPPGGEDDGTPASEEEGGSGGAEGEAPEGEDASSSGQPEAGLSEGEESDTVTLVIENGATSYSVCQELERLGLVEDASGFDEYLRGLGYTRIVWEGTFEITKGASEEEIAKIITGKR